MSYYECLTLGSTWRLALALGDKNSKRELLRRLPSTNIVRNIILSSCHHKFITPREFKWRILWAEVEVDGGWCWKILTFARILNRSGGAKLLSLRRGSCDLVGLSKFFFVQLSRCALVLIFFNSFQWFCLHLSLCKCHKPTLKWPVLVFPLSIDPKTFI